MTMQVVGQLGSISFHELKLPDGIQVPQIGVHEVNVPGLLGDLVVFNRFKGPICNVITSTFTIKDSTSIGIEDTARSYIGYPQTFTAQTARSASDNYTALVIDVQIGHEFGIPSEDITLNTQTIIRWKLKFYRQAS